MPQFFILLALLLVGCTAGDAKGSDRPNQAATMESAAATPAANDTSYRLRPGYVVDSALPREELLRRFREGTRETTALRGGASSRDALVRDFFAALARTDSAKLDQMVVTREEWAWLVFPDSPASAPPYNQRPDAAWLLLSAGSDKGRHRLLERFTGGGHELVDYRCAEQPAVEGGNRIWRGCRTRLRRTDGDTVTMRLFGAILERDGRYKFISYQNDL